MGNQNLYYSDPVTFVTFVTLCYGESDFVTLFAPLFTFNNGLCKLFKAVTRNNKAVTLCFVKLRRCFSFNCLVLARYLHRARARVFTKTLLINRANGI